MLLLSFALVVYTTHRKQVRQHHFLDRAIVWVSSPLQWVVSSGIAAVYDVWEHYIYLQHTREHESQLLEQVGRLRQRLVNQKELVLENQRLRQLLALHEKYEHEADMLAARVIATTSHPVFRSVRLNRGTHHGVAVGQGVVNHQGVVGRIAAVGMYTSEVMLVVDANSSLAVRVQRTRDHARIQGYGNNENVLLNLQYLSRTAQIRLDDVVVTSGVGSVFPQGLVVGKISDVERTGFGLYQKASLEPIVDFGRLETVMVLLQWWPTADHVALNEKS